MSDLTKGDSKSYFVLSVIKNENAHIFPRHFLNMLISDSFCFPLYEW